MFHRIWETDDLVVDVLSKGNDANYILYKPTEHEKYIVVSREELIAFAKSLLESE